MFERLKNAWNRLQSSPVHSEPLAEWAVRNELDYTPLAKGAFILSGQWWAQPVRIECAAPSRPYITGMELMARVDLARTLPGGVVLMNRPLKHHLEQWASELYSQYTDTLQTTAQAVPDEIRWLSMYRDAGWSGPDRDFWARYAALTDVPDIARQWIDDENLARLMRWPAQAVGPQTPLLLMLLKSKAYMRLQIDDVEDTDTVVHAFELFRHLGEQARRLQALG